MAGPIVASFIGGLEGSVIVCGLSALGGALFSIGISKDSVMQYERALKSDKFLVIAHRCNEELERAKGIISDTFIVAVNVYSKESVTSYVYSNNTVETINPYPH